MQTKTFYTCSERSVDILKGRQTFQHRTNVPTQRRASGLAFSFTFTFKLNVHLLKRLEETKADVSLVMDLKVLFGQNTNIGVHTHT